MSETVLVTEREYAKAEQVFRLSQSAVFKPAPAAEEALASAIVKASARAVIVGVDRYSGELYRALKETSQEQGAVIVRFGVGHDSVDKERARENGIFVCNTPGVLDISVAEHTLWLMGNLARHIPRLEATMRAGEFTGQTGSELRGCSLGILGFGNIGRRVAEMAHFGFGMRVFAGGNASGAELSAREHRGLDEIQKTHGLEFYTHDTDRLLHECDYVSVHLPATPATRHFIDARRLKLMKPTARLINTARGSILDEAALYDALAGKHLAGAALDVFEFEPYRPAAESKDLRKLANVVLTPHVGSNTFEANQRMAQACIENIRHFFAGERGSMTQVRVS